NTSSPRMRGPALPWPPATSRPPASPPLSCRPRSLRQLYANFPETHALWVGNLAGNSLNSLNYPKSADVIINVGNKFQHNGPAPIVPRGPKFIDMRIDHGSMGNVMITEVPLVCDVGYGLDDLIAAVEQLLTPALRQKAADRAVDVSKFGE